MIQFITRKKLDVDKYNACIENSMQSNIYGFSWYLDLACDNWSVFVLNDYEAVMPVPWRKKFFIKYVYPPLWIIQLGIYSKVIEDENEFLIELFSQFKYVQMRTNTQNAFSMFQPYQIEKRLQVLQMKSTFENIIKGFRKDRRRALTKSQKSALKENWKGNPEDLITLHKQNVGKRAKDFNEHEYDKLLRVIKLSIVKGRGEVLSIYDSQNKLVASGFFLLYNKSVVKLVSATDFNNRKNGANTFLIERAIFKYHNDFDVFDFGGSSMKTIADFNLSFGSSHKVYSELQYNNLPKLLKLFKK